MRKIYIIIQLCLCLILIIQCKKKEITSSTRIYKSFLSGDFYVELTLIDSSNYSINCGELSNDVHVVGKYTRNKDTITFCSSFSSDTNISFKDSKLVIVNDTCLVILNLF